MILMANGLLGKPNVRVSTIISARFFDMSQGKILELVNSKCIFIWWNMTVGEDVTCSGKLWIFFFFFLIYQDGNSWNLAKYEKKKKIGKTLCPTSVANEGRGVLESYIRRVSPWFLIASSISSIFLF